MAVPQPRSVGCADFQRASRMSRRNLLSAGLATFGGLSLPQMLRAEALGEAARRGAKAKHIIFLHQFGGVSHIDTFDMKPEAPEGIRGSFRPIDSAVPGVPITEHLPRWAEVLDRCAIVRSVHHEMKNHNSAGFYSLTGHAPPLDDIRLRDTPELYPAYGSVAAKLAPVADPAVPSFVSYPHVLSDGSKTPGQHASFLGKEYDPFFLGADPNDANFGLPELDLPADVSVDRLGKRRSLLSVVDQQRRLLEHSAVARGIDTFQERAIAMLLSPKVRQAFDLSQEKETVREAYGRTTYGQSCLLARRLVEAGVRFVTVYFARGIGGNGSHGWDTHQKNFSELKDRLLPATDQPVPTLIRDLEERGLLDETLIFWAGEFGRGPKIGDRDGQGRGHWPKCYSVVFAGGGVRGGTVYGSSDRIGAYPAENAVRPDDLAATMYHALGIDPQTEVHDTLNRPLPITRGKPIYELFG